VLHLQLACQNTMPTIDLASTTNRSKQTWPTDLQTILQTAARQLPQFGLGTALRRPWLPGQPAVTITSPTGLFRAKTCMSLLSRYPPAAHYIIGYEACTTYAVHQHTNNVGCRAKAILQIAPAAQHPSSWKLNRHHCNDMTSIGLGMHGSIDQAPHQPLTLGMPHLQTTGL